MERKVSKERMERIRSLFEEAVEIPPSEQETFLKERCGEDEYLKGEVISLLKRWTEVDSEFKEIEAGIDEEKRNLSEEEKPGQRIDYYTLVSIIGSGGFCTVWLAEQERPVRRQVALKILRSGMATEEIIARFELERQALALMNHPHIAMVFDAGTTRSGRPYFVMERVDGIPVTRFCDEERLPLTQRIQLMIEICHAVQHAHQRGIIHRDLKPSNILVSKQDGKPLPKVIDFGIAKAEPSAATVEPLLAENQSFVGTPVYTSPEQLSLGAMNVDTRSDIYSLGVILYELLIGRLPFNPEPFTLSSIGTIRRFLLQAEAPPRPSVHLKTLAKPDCRKVAQQRCVDVKRLHSLLTGDLDWIVIHTLEKEPSRRYPTANAFALDLEHYLRGQPVTAHPPHRIYRLRKLVQRNKVAVVAVTAVACALLLGTVLATWQAVRATVAEGKMESALQREASARVKAEGLLFESHAEEMLLKEAQGDSTYALAHAIAALERTDTQKRRRLALHALWKGPTRFRLKDAEKLGPSGHIGFSPDGKWMATGSRKPHILFYPSDGGAPEILPVENVENTIFAKYSPSGRLLLSGHYLTSGKWGPYQAIIWDSRTKTREKTINIGDWAPYWFNHDESRLLAYNIRCEFPYAGFSWLSLDGEIREHIGSPSEEPPGSNNYGFPPFHLDTFIPSGNLQKVVHWKGTELYVSPLNKNAFGERTWIGHHDHPITSGSIDYAGRLVSSADQFEFRIWDVSDPGNVVASIPSGIIAPTFDPYSPRLYHHSANWREHAVFYDLRGPAMAEPLSFFPIEWVPDYPCTIPGKDWVAVQSGQWGLDREIYLYPMRSVWPFLIDLRVETPPELVDQRASRFLDKSRVLIFQMGVMTLVDFSSHEPLKRTLFEFPELVYTAKVDPENERVVMGTWSDGAFLLWLDKATSIPLETSPTWTSAVAFSEDGDLIALAGGSQDPREEMTVHVLDAEGTPVHRLNTPAENPIWDLVFLSGKELIVSTSENGLIYWNFTTDETRIIKEGSFRRLSLSKDFLLAPELEALWLFDRKTLEGHILEAVSEQTFATAISQDQTFVAGCNIEGDILVHYLGEEGCHFVPCSKGHVWDLWIDPKGLWMKVLTSEGKIVCLPIPRGRPLVDRPLEELLAVLKRQTNIRFMSDPETPIGYREFTTEFAGWETHPGWQEWYSREYMAHPPWQPMVPLSLVESGTPE